MARPNTWHDLSDNDRRGDEIVRWSGNSIMSIPNVTKHLVAAAQAARSEGLVVDNDGIFAKPSDEVLEDRLRRAQERWDSLEEKYKVAVDFQSPNSELWEINNWARENSLPVIKPV